LPTLTYEGVLKWRPAPGGLGTVERGVANEVSQEWLDRYALILGPDWVVGGGDLPTLDEGNDGIPDPSWTVANIKKWLGDEGVELGYGYKTKTVLLGMVEEHLNPSAPEPVVEEVVEVAETELENTME